MLPRTNRCPTWRQGSRLDIPWVCMMPSAPLHRLTERAENLQQGHSCWFCYERAITLPSVLRRDATRQYRIAQRGHQKAQWYPRTESIVDPTRRIAMFLSPATDQPRAERYMVQGNINPNFLKKRSFNMEAYS